MKTSQEPLNIGKLRSVIQEISGGFELSIQSLYSQGKLTDSDVGRILNRGDQIKVLARDFFNGALPTLSKPFDTSCLKFERELDKLQSVSIREADILRGLERYRGSYQIARFLKGEELQTRPPTRVAVFRLDGNSTCDEVFGGFDIGLDKLSLSVSQFLHIAGKIEAWVQTIYLLKIGGDYFLTSLKQYHSPDHIQVESCFPYHGSCEFRHHFGKRFIMPIY